MLRKADECHCRNGNSLYPLWRLMPSSINSEKSNADSDAHVCGDTKKDNCFAVTETYL